jgi:predicted RNA-binding protein associated with RNAse of E/G family
VWVPVTGGIEWLDEDEVEPALAAGAVTAAEIEQARIEGARAIAAFQPNARPFCDGWQAWRPDESWPVPRLPPGWDG